jgi:2-C-methyl-D-erythritol 4-phosphate cytidylyltransferase
MKNYGIILAGGIGARVGLNIPKQMVKVAGKTILEHTIDIFENSDSIDEIIVMITQGWSGRVQELLDHKYSKLSFILEGGATRNETTKKMLNHLTQRNVFDNDNLILHDAVRPLLSEQVIKNSVKALENYNAVDVVIPSTDTIVEIDDNGIIKAIPKRSYLRRGQTPQSFKFGVLKEAYDIAFVDKAFNATDDCGVVLRYLPEEKIICIDGSENNIKVTQPVDLFIADKLFQLNSKLAPKLNTSELKKVFKDKTVIIFGGSYGIGADIATLASKYGANVVAHGRSTTGIDISDKKAVKKALNSAYKKYGKINYIVLTAGVLKIGRLNDMEPEQIDELINLNYTSAVNIAKESYGYLKESAGHLLLFTSSSYTRGRENYSLYSSSKAAIVNLTQALSEEWATDNIKINAINPERTQTPMRQNAFGDEPAETLLSSEKVAKSSINVLASNLTGQVIDVRR